MPDSVVFLPPSGHAGCDGFAHQHQFNGPAPDLRQHCCFGQPPVDPTLHPVRFDATHDGAAPPLSPGHAKAPPVKAASSTPDDNRPPPNSAKPQEKQGVVAQPASGSHAVDGGGPNSLTLRNNTDQPITVAFFRNLAPGEHPSFDGPDATFTIGAHQSIQVSMPADWQGRAQKWSGSTQDYSNWAELNFEGGTGKIWFDESDILGRNSSIKITAPDGAVAGTDRSILADAPPGLVVVDSSGHRVIKAPQWFDRPTDPAAAGFLASQLGTDKAYVLPDDNQAVRVSSANALTIDFGDA